MLLKRLSLSFILLGLLISCSKKSDDGSEEDSGPSPKALYQEDRQQFLALSSAGPETFDAESNDLFSKVFGGPASIDVARYLDERIRHVWNEKNQKSMHIKNKKNNKPYKIIVERPKDQPDSAVASNFGARLWIASLRNDAIYELQYDKDTVTAQDSRVGIILLTQNYKKDLRTKGEVSVDPVEFRMGIIVHEARHSDCTGGLTNEDIDLMRKTRSNHSSCTHPHVRCPQGHNLEGILACDSQVWGAYGIGAIYMAAMARNYPEDDPNARMLNIVAMDNLNRISGVELEAMYSTEPDMSSSGIH